MKSITASDRSNLIKLASSLPKGDTTRRAILAGLAKTKQAAGKLTIEGLSPKVQAMIDATYKKVKAQELRFGWGKKVVSSPDKYEEEEGKEYNVPVGFGAFGSIIKLLKPEAKEEVLAHLESIGMKVADTDAVLKSFKSDFVGDNEDEDDDGSWRWEDTTATFGDSFRMTKGKVVDGLSVTKLINRLDK
jgi:hypothetical protein